MDVTNKTIVPGIYRHYKGNCYQVIGVGKHTETEEEVVLYQSLYGDYALWVRPKVMFTEMVWYNNEQIRRFTLIKANSLQEIDSLKSS